MSTANPNLREPSSDLSDSLGETVWKIAEGVSSTLLWRQEAADRDFFDPSWPLRSPDSGSIPNFQTVSEEEFSEIRLQDPAWNTLLEPQGWLLRACRPRDRGLHVVVVYEDALRRIGSGPIGGPYPVHRRVTNARSSGVPADWTARTIL